MKIRESIKDYDIDCINTIASYLAKRDIEELGSKELLQKHKIQKVDLLILLGNSIPDTAEIAAEAWKEGIARRFMIVGGKGHSTDYLRENIQKQTKYRDIPVEGRSEAEILFDVIQQYYYLSEEKALEKESIKEEILLEKESTNCGNNAEKALEVSRQHSLNSETVLLIQDPTMQRRTDASFKKVWSEEGAVFINFAPFIPHVQIITAADETGAADRKMLFTNKGINDLWDMERFLSLLLGEIPRLYDDENGYGPAGRGYIEHVDIPSNVMLAYRYLTDKFDYYLRKRLNP